MRTIQLAQPPIGGRRAVHGRRLFVDRRGDGDPTVVFLPGAGLTGLDYLHLHERVARTRSSMVYDRAGTGWSDPVALPRSSAAVVDELAELLTATGGARVVLVGHSLGGLYARHFAIRHPGVVAGLVLLDPAHEDYDAAMPVELTEQRSGTRRFDVMNAVLDACLSTTPTRALLERLPPVRRYQRLYRRLFCEELAEWPDDVRASLIERHVSLDWLAVGLRESRRLDELYAEIRSAAGVPLPDVPVVILCSTGTDGFRDAVSSGEGDELLRAEVEAKRRLYERVVATGLRGEVRDVDTGHVTLPFRARDAVLQAIDDVSA